MKCMRIALGVACAMGLSIGSAYAHDQSQGRAHDSFHAAISGCHKLPVSERGICKAEVQRRADAAYMAASVSEPAAWSGYVIPDRTALKAEMTRYKRLSSACHRAPISEKGSCLDEASLGRARPAQLQSAA